MLTEAQKQENKARFVELLSLLNIDLTNLYKYLDHVDYFEKPATVQCYRPYAGGLCKYALDTYDELTKLCALYYPDGRYSQEDIIKVALFKDLYRAELYEAFAKNVKNDATGQWESVIAYRVKAERPVFGEIGFSSYMIAKYFILLNDEHIEAICQARASDFGADTHEVCRSYPLVTLTKMADLAVSYISREATNE